MVLTEFLNSFSTRGTLLRKRAAETAKGILNNPNVKVVAQTREQFNEALSLFSDREDKEWGLTDCSSIKICIDNKINEVLTADHHFQQAGLIALLL